MFIYIYIYTHITYIKIYIILTSRKLILHLPGGLCLPTPVLPYHQGGYKVDPYYDRYKWNEISPLEMAGKYMAFAGVLSPPKGWSYGLLLVSDMGPTSYVKKHLPRRLGISRLGIPLQKNFIAGKIWKKARRFWIDIRFSVSVDVFFPYRYPKRPLIWRCWIDFIAFQISTR